MAKLAGAFLNFFSTLLYAITFVASAVILGIYSYFLAFHTRHNLAIPTWEKAVEGIAGAACLYLVFCVLLTCFLGGKSFFAFLAIVLDVLFCGAMLAIAVMTRQGRHSCANDAYVHTPVGSGKGSSGLPDTPNLAYMCGLNKSVFAISLIAAGLFLVSALFQFFIGRHHQKEKRFGPSPANNYTSGSGTKWFNRRNRGPKTTRDAYAAKDAEAAAGAGGLAAPATLLHDDRPSHDTAYTGSTVGYAHDAKTAPPVPVPAAGGYHTAPAGTGIGSAGYEKHARPVGTNF